MTPLTHHDILRLARPLVEHGWRIELAACSREHRRIVCRPAEPDDDALSGVMVLEAIDADTVELTRAARWICPGSARSDGVSSLSARVELADLEALVRLMNALPDASRATHDTHALLVLDEVLLPDRPVGHGHGGAARRVVRSLRVRCPPLVLDVDASTSAGSPADVRLWHEDAPLPTTRTMLASGALHPDSSPVARIARQWHTPTPMTNRHATPDRVPLDAAAARALLHQLPDDLLATLSPHWRVLRWQGGYWKGALAHPRRVRGRPGGDARGGASGGPPGAAYSTGAGRAGLDALHGLQDLVRSPRDWHLRHGAARRGVFLRRLKPLMVLVAILSVMPIAWFATSHGDVELHPLLLGITPLLMVGMIALSAREIPVMEWPPRPEPLPDELTAALTGET